MIPVVQTITERGRGNCFAACLAALLEMPLDKVPNFVGDDAGGNYWFDRCNLWLQPLGFALFMVAREAMEKAWLPNGVKYIASVDGPRGVRHAIVMETGFPGEDSCLLHDPYPGEPCTGREPCHFLYFLIRLL